MSAASGHGSTVFQWLVERGQLERQEPTVWLENSALHPARDEHWTTDAREAAMFPTRKAAEDYIAERLTHPARGPSARAVEHGFMTIEGGTMLEYPRPDGHTNYEAVVSKEIRDHTEALMRDWREDGRDDGRIEGLVKSCVLAAFAAGRDAGLREVYDFTKARVRGEVREA